MEFLNKYTYCSPASNHYLGHNSVIEASLLVMLELLSFCTNVDDTILLCIKLAGCVGVGIGSKLPLSMRTTEVILGLSLTFSCTHSSPILIHLNISVIGPPLNVGSMRFEVVPPIFQSLRK